jgi:hypothetical protein
MHLINAWRGREREGGREVPWDVELQVKDNRNVDVIKADWISDYIELARHSVQ